MLRGLTIDDEAGTVTIILDLEPERVRSASGKSLMLASTRGLHWSGDEREGRPVIVGANVYIPCAGPASF